MRHILGRTLRASFRKVQASVGCVPLPVMFWLLKLSVITFNYHVVTDQDLPHVKHLFPYKTPKAFEEDLRFIRRKYQLVSFDELVEHIYHGRRWTKPAAFITFDDGMVECFGVARPILLRYRVPCTFFITTKLIGNNEAFYRHKVSLCIDRVLRANGSRQSMLRNLRDAADSPAEDVDSFIKWIKGLKYAERQVIDAACAVLGVDEAAFLREVRPYMTMDHLATLVKDGFTLGGHGTVHVNLAELTDTAAIEFEIVQSCKFVATIASQQQVPFAFPFSASGVDRELLGHIVSKHPFIPLMFGTQGIAKDRSFIMNRVAADIPNQFRRDAGTIPSVVRSACAEVL
jgi:peptidoglycan/xylan/chitin deacetylase (PgdA/CDA1 family)